MRHPTLVVFSHLRWGFVHQRPQHLMSRLSRHWRVWFVEEPVRCTGEARIETRQVDDQLTLVVPHTPVDAPGFHVAQVPTLKALLTAFFARLGVQDAVAWVYTPMALPLLATLDHRCVAYDCMDELSAFKDAPKELRDHEAALLRRAAVVFTGGPSLYEARRRRHPNVHCVPSSVDARHFAPGARRHDGDGKRAVEALQAALPRPRLGFFGVIDERLDTALLQALADARPRWQIVMVGPVVKIDPQSLPRRPNLHWLGMQAYDDLPHFLAGWDVCLMPFALNESTRFISPTKTLEYMAGGKPVVSTPVADVVSMYASAVTVAPGAAAFVDACEAVMAEGPAARTARAAEMKAIVARNSWDRSAAHVHELLTLAWQRAGAARHAGPLTAGTAGAVAPSPPLAAS